MARIVALVVAAGRGRRLGGDIPKQYLDLAGRPVLRHTLAALATNPQIGAVRTVIHPDDRDLYEAAAQGLAILEPVAGGETRQDSVRLGLESLAESNPDLVLIHDAARPFIDPGIIGRVVAALADKPGAIPAIPVADTLKRAINGSVGATVDRAELWRAQTPQGFRFPDIMAAHRALAGEELTDDAALAERAGLKVALVMGAEDNFKITAAADLERARQVFSGPGDFRTGSGIDVHRFAPGTGVWLCGIQVPHDASLEGHSDADVALHAVTDAVLGAISAGDIGHHFPPSEPRWKGAASHSFLAHAGRLVTALGGRVVHVDVTIVCERPKIGPHRAAMQARIAEILGLRQDRVSIKATTTEGLGFTGRREGIAAQAAATIWLPR
jgi:2-C-methyl-D-erythritol 4-phosphate cytidylyltransferase/2-C-methyl-D-erythritol 2,4-cyclodiphosphate synthase